MNHAVTAGALACLYHCGMHSTKLSAIRQKYHIPITKDIKVLTEPAMKTKVCFGVIYCRICYVIIPATLV